jgi:hypothetical protein
MEHIYEYKSLIGFPVRWDRFARSAAVLRRLIAVIVRSAQVYFDVQVDLEYHRVWDSYCLQLDVLKSSEGCDLVYWYVSLRDSHLRTRNCPRISRACAGSRSFRGRVRRSCCGLASFRALFQRRLLFAVSNRDYVYHRRVGVDNDTAGSIIAVAWT